MPDKTRRRLLIFGGDVIAAFVVALFVFRLFGAVSGVDTNPPVCYNAAGGEVSCALTPTALMAPVFVCVVLVLVTWQVRREIRSTSKNEPVGG